MGQSEIIELLKKEIEPIGVKEITLKLTGDCSLSHYTKISNDINKMLKYKEVFYIEINRFEAMKRFKCKRRLRLYYINKKNGNS
jgi:hypothetical protein